MTRMRFTQKQPGFLSSGMYEAGYHMHSHAAIDHITTCVTSHLPVSLLPDFKSMARLFCPPPSLRYKYQVLATWLVLRNHQHYLIIPSPVPLPLPAGTALEDVSKRVSLEIV